MVSFKLCRIIEISYDFQIFSDVWRRPLLSFDLGFQAAKLVDGAYAAVLLRDNEGWKYALRSIKLIHLFLIQ